MWEAHPGTARRAQVLAVAGAAGVLHVVDVPRALRRRTAGEVNAMAALLERGRRQLEYVQERQAARAKQQKVGGRGLGAAAPQRSVCGTVVAAAS